MQCAQKSYWELNRAVGRLVPGGFFHRPCVSDLQGPARLNGSAGWGEKQQFAQLTALNSFAAAGLGSEGRRGGGRGLHLLR